jgi:hypothetical protein
MIFPRGFSVEKKYEMEVEGYLHKVVQLDNASEGYMRVSRPEV